MDDDDYSVFYGFGTVHDLRDHDAPPPRLLGMRSVSNRAAWALHDNAPPKVTRIGFKIPRGRR